MPDTRSKSPRPVHSSPSIGTRGQPAVYQSGGVMTCPPRVQSCAPSQRPRTPSSFSLTQYSATRRPGAYTFAFITAGGFGGASAKPTAACSSASDSSSRNMNKGDT